MSAVPEYVPITIPHRGHDILLSVRAEDQIMGAASIYRDGAPVASIAPSAFRDFETAKIEMTERGKDWIDQHLDAAPTD
ncbi:hypothetical protein [Comamonas antarctica]|uniref:hypothetical protein n=1 Tax=Comamonas antarctica TaxID=2743470 RepID=UPI0028E4D999|nr:hypothetical protein [Comamonas antarctica]